MSKQSYTIGINDGFLLGKNLSSLSVPLQKKLRYCLQQKSLTDYIDGLHFGYAEGKKELARETLYQRRKMEMETTDKEQIRSHDKPKER